MSRHYKLEHVNEITGTFVILAVIILVGAFVGMAYRQRWFQHTIPLRIVMPPSGAAGIRQGADVEFLGTSVGTVLDVVLLKPRGRMIAKADIRDDYFPVMHQDSVASVKKTLGLAGSSYFDISQGQGPPLPWTDATIDCKEETPSVESNIEQIGKEVMPVLDKGNASMDQVQGILKEVQTASTHISSLSQSMDRQAQQDLPGLILQAQQTLQEMQTLIKGIEGIWPIRSHIPQCQSNTRIPPGEVVP